MTALGEPVRVGICHCLDCRRHHGTLFFAAAIFAQAAVTVAGETKSYEGRHFCPRCGSSVFAQSGDEIDLHLGAMEAAESLVPQYELWTVRRLPWLPEFPDMVQIPRNRESPDSVEGWREIEDESGLDGRGLSG
ncbi:GFA family protein [Pararhodobacter zhoushanensis]|uniref:GFA family protein n=1 Tax=Pararhodobacter zhoushanensis TaxID=2479545 RepID=UPI003CCC75AE